MLPQQGGKRIGREAVRPPGIVDERAVVRAEPEAFEVAADGFLIALDVGELEQIDVAVHIDHDADDRIHDVPSVGVKEGGGNIPPPTHESANGVQNLMVLFVELCHVVTGSIDAQPGIQTCLGERQQIALQLAAEADQIFLTLGIRDGVGEVEDRLHGGENGAAGVRALHVHLVERIEVGAGGLEENADPLTHNGFVVGHVTTFLSCVCLAGMAWR